MEIAVEGGDGVGDNEFDRDIGGVFKEERGVTMSDDAGKVMAVGGGIGIGAGTGGGCFLNFEFDLTTTAGAAGDTASFSGLGTKGDETAGTVVIGLPFT